MKETYKRDQLTLYPIAAHAATQHDQILRLCTKVPGIPTGISPAQTGAPKTTTHTLTRLHTLAYPPLLYIHLPPLRPPPTVKRRMRSLSRRMRFLAHILAHPPHTYRLPPLGGRSECHVLQHTAALCSALQHAATHCVLLPIVVLTCSWGY